MDNWRIQTFFEDKSTVVKPTTSALGFTVIKAPKGTDYMYFDVGQAGSIIDCCGYPAYSNGVQDAIDYNKKAPLYVNAPSTNGKFGGVFVTKTGTIPFYSGYSSWDTFDLKLIPQSMNAGTGDASKVLFNVTLTNFAKYNARSLTISINGTPDTLVFDTSVAGIETITGSLCTAVLTKSTGALAITFTTAPAILAVVTVDYTININDDCYFVLRNYSKCVDDIAVKVLGKTNGLFSIAVYKKDKNNDFSEITNSPFEVSLNPKGTNANGKNIYVENVFKESKYLKALDTETAFSTFADDTALVNLAGGSRGDTVTNAVIASSYLALTDKNKYPVKVFFDGNADATIATAFETLRNGIFNRSRFILTTPDSTETELISGAATSRYNLSNRGIYVYCLTWGTHVDSYYGNDFNCSNVGLIAGRHADSINKKHGGIGPMWYDENEVGGQLGSAITSLNQSVTEINSKALDTLRLNPVKWDISAGAMIVSDRTTLITDGDYSYIGPSGLADYIAFNIEKLVLPNQLGKLNDMFHRNSVKANAETILKTVSDLLYDYYVKCDEENNNSEILNAKKFVLTVGVQYTPQSEMIDFIFINSSIGVDIKEVVNKG